MYHSRTESLANGRALEFALELDGNPIAFKQVLLLWQTDPTFCSFINALLADSPFSAFRWEMPPVSAATANRPFEFVLLDSPGLVRTPDIDAFAEHFHGGDEGDVVEFANLGKDAILIVPRPIAVHSAYIHLGAFVRQAPETQRHALWACVGSAMQRRISKKPVWLSTAGAGVAWLHVRLDNRPKYYGHGSYRDGR